MKTELSPEFTRTCSKGHVKIANNNSFTDLAEIIGHGRNNIRLQCLELSTTCYRNLSCQTKACHASTKDKEQNSLIELISKINRKHGSIYANKENDMTDSDMAETTISRQVGELVQLTTEQ